MSEHRLSPSYEAHQRVRGDGRSGVRHVLGVAFPHMSAGPPHDIDLERAFLQLSYTVLRFTRAGESASGYFAVLRQEVRDAVLRMSSRYEVGASVHIVFTSLLISDMTRLAEAGDAAKLVGNPSIVTEAGRQIATDALRREILLREPDAVEHVLKEEMPFGIQWDYYATVRSPAGLTTEENS